MKQYKVELCTGLVRVKFQVGLLNYRSLNYVVEIKQVLHKKDFPWDEVNKNTRKRQSQGNLKSTTPIFFGLRL